MERLLAMPSTQTTRTIHRIDSALGTVEGTAQFPTAYTKREARRLHSQPVQTFVTA